MKLFIEDQIENLKQSVLTVIPDYNRVKPLDAARTILLYDKLFRSNYPLWLTLADQSLANANFINKHNEMLLKLTVNTMSYCLPSLAKRMAETHADIDAVTQNITPYLSRLTCAASGQHRFFIVGAFESVMKEMSPWMKEVIQHRTNMINQDGYFRMMQSLPNSFTSAYIAKVENDLFTPFVNPGKDAKFQLETNYREHILAICKDLRSVFASSLYFVRSMEHA